MNDTLRLVALNAGIATAGATLLVLARFPLQRAWWASLLGLAPATGLAFVGLIAAVGAMVGIGTAVATISLLALVALILFRLASSRQTLDRGSLAPRGRRNPLERVAEAGVLALLAFLSFGVVRLAAATGLDGWDGWAMWAPKAHALFVEGDVWGPVFRAPEYVMILQQYPIYLPSLEALSSDALGRYDPHLLDVEAAVVIVAFAWASWGLLRLVVVPTVAAAVALALLGGTPLVGNAVANYADSVVAAFTALGLLATLVWATTGATFVLVPAAVFLGAAASTKSEGLAFAVAAIVAAALLAPALGRSRRVLVVFAAAVFAVPAMWSVVDRLNGPAAKTVRTDALLDPAYLAAAADRIPLSATTLTGEIRDDWPLASLAVLFAVGAACLARVWWPTVFVALWAGLSFAALVGAYYLSTSPIDWQLGTSADRVVFSIVLGAATASPVLIGLAWERAAVTLRGVVAERTRGGTRAKPTTD